MKPIKVYLQYPWKFPDSPYYKYLVENPPEGINFENISNQKGVITNKKFFWFSNFLKRNIRRIFNFFNKSIPNAHLSPDGDYNLIHCAHCLSKNKNKPWVADIEGAWQIYVGNKSYNSKNKLKIIFSEKNCKKILSWTKKTKEELLTDFPILKNKIEVVYPGIPEKHFSKKNNSKKINIIFSGRYFYNKGGLHALEAINQLTKKYKNVYGIINSEVPEKILNQYSQNNKLKFYSLIPQNKLFELYQDSHILLYPGYSDSFGFAYLEAMSFGIPIVTVDGFARKEIVDEGKTGFVISKPQHLDPMRMNPQIISELVKKTSPLIKNVNLREKMSKNCLKVIKDGKFSIKVRNEKLKKVYGDAVK